MNASELQAANEYRDKCLRDLVDALGCGDNSCIFRKPRGMATNGGCRCFEALPHPLRWLTYRFVRAAMEAGGYGRQEARDAR